LPGQSGCVGAAGAVRGALALAQRRVAWCAHLLECARATLAACARAGLRMRVGGRPAHGCADVMPLLMRARRPAACRLGQGATTCAVFRVCDRALWWHASIALWSAAIKRAVCGHVWGSQAGLARRRVSSGVRAFHRGAQAQVSCVKLRPGTVLASHMALCMNLAQRCVADRASALARTLPHTP